VRNEGAARHAAQVARAERAHQRARALLAARRGARARGSRGAAEPVAARPWLRACRRAGRQRHGPQSGPCAAQAPARRQAPPPPALLCGYRQRRACARLPSLRGQPHPGPNSSPPRTHACFWPWARTYVAGVQGRREGALERDRCRMMEQHYAPALPRRSDASPTRQALVGPAPGSGRVRPRSTAAPGAARSRPAGARKKRRASSSGRLPQRRRASAWARGAHGRADRQPVQASADHALQRAG